VQGAAGEILRVGGDDVQPASIDEVLVRLRLHHAQRTRALADDVAQDVPKECW
jgi:hypothetical protein